MALGVELPVFSAFDPDFCIPKRQAAGDPEAVHLAELRALRTEALGGAAVAHRVRKVLMAHADRAVTRREAEALFDIAETTREGASADFAALLAAAVANHLLSAGAGAAEASIFARSFWLDATVLASVQSGVAAPSLFAQVVTAALTEERVSACEGWVARGASDATLQAVTRAADPARSWVAERLGRRSAALSRAEALLVAVLKPCCDLTPAGAVAKAA